MTDPVAHRAKMGPARGVGSRGTGPSWREFLSSKALAVFRRGSEKVKYSRESRARRLGKGGFPSARDRDGPLVRPVSTNLRIASRGGAPDSWAAGVWDQGVSTRALEPDTAGVEDE